IYYHVSERQPRPTLIGFSRPHERAFFEKLIQVEDIGPIKAARALTLSISTIARAIEDDDVRTLRRLDGIGERTAHKIVATLRGRVAAEALLRDEGFVSAAPQSIKTDVAEETAEALQRLGYSRTEARAAIEAALERCPGLQTTEELIQEVFRGQRG
ncbi:MAG: Holliday junction DNA helicase RuvA, partial [Chloroflexi bacterium]|nr:Holliday junction DNA helicase RuvA [Chloroflexota bacterium]